MTIGYAEGKMKVFAGTKGGSRIEPNRAEQMRAEPSRTNVKREKKKTKLMRTIAIFSGHKIHICMH